MNSPTMSASSGESSSSYSPTPFRDGSDNDLESRSSMDSILYPGEESPSSDSGLPLRSGFRSSGGASDGKRKENEQWVPSSNSVSKLRRRNSDSILSTAILETDSRISDDIKASLYRRSSPTLQFSPEVHETGSASICAEKHEASEDEMSQVNNPSSPNLPEEGAAKRNEESVASSSSENVSRSGNIGEFDHILRELSPKEKKSFHAAKEILLSERTYLDVVNLLLTDFVECLKIAKEYHGVAVISEKEINIILDALRYCIKVNEIFLPDFEERISNWTETPKIADVMLKTGHFLKIYTSYINDLPKNTELLQSYRKKYPLFQETVKKFEKEKSNGLWLEAHLLKPAQRVMHYQSLLESYLKTLDKENVDYEHAVAAVALFRDVAEHANEIKRQSANGVKLFDLQQQVPFTKIIKEGRYLEKLGDLDVIYPKRKATRVVALMSDCLMYFKNFGITGMLLKCKELPLNGMSVSLATKQVHEYEFTLTSTTCSFNVVAKTSKEREKWMEAFNRAIKGYARYRTFDQEPGLKFGGKAPVWIPDSEASMCMICDSEFTYIRRRHHCRACGKVVCRDCSDHTAPLQYLQNAEGRVCVACYQDYCEGINLIPGESSKTKHSILNRFNNFMPKGVKKIKWTVPQLVEGNDNNSISKLRGFLEWRKKSKEQWKRQWFDLVQNILYAYKGSEDGIASDSVTLSGWHAELKNSEPSDKKPTKYLFTLNRVSESQIQFRTDNEKKAQEWVEAINEAALMPVRPESFKELGSGEKLPNFKKPNYQN